MIVWILKYSDMVEGNKGKCECGNMASGYWESESVEKIKWRSSQGGAYTSANVV